MASLNAALAKSVVRTAASLPLTCLLLLVFCKLSGASGFLPRIAKDCQNGTNVSSQRSWVLEAFEAGLPFGISMLFNRERRKAFESHAGAQGQGLADSRQEGATEAAISTKWISVIRKDIPAALYEAHGAFGFLFSLDHLWPCAVKGTMHSGDESTEALSLSELIDEEHPSKSKVYGKRGNLKEAKAEFDVDLEHMLRNMSPIPPVGVAWCNEMRVLSDEVPADAFVGIVVGGRKVMKDEMSLQKLEAEKVRIISEFRRITGRADAPFFGYVGIPPSDYQYEFGNVFLCPDKFLRDMITLRMGETSFPDGGSILWQIPDQTNTDIFLRHMISANLSIT